MCNGRFSAGWNQSRCDNAFWIPNLLFNVLAFSILIQCYVNDKNRPKTGMDG